MQSHSWPMPATRFNYHVPAYRAPVETIQPPVLRFMLAKYALNRGEGGNPHNSRVVAVCLAEKRFNLVQSAAFAALDEALRRRGVAA